ncbi:MAG: phosphatase PAP2 family protein [Cellulosilyticaceae bacterium]
MNWEIMVLQQLEAIRQPFLTAIIEALTFFAESGFVALVIAILYWCVDKKKGVKLGWTVLLSGVVNGAIKNIFKMPRPFQVGVVSPIRVETATGYSFPSGHTQTATSFWGALMMMVKTRNMVILGSIMIVLTAFSRVYLGVHWPIDVIGGIITGIGCVIIADRLMDEQKGITPQHVLGISILTLFLMLLRIDPDLAKTVGALWGLVVGAYLEQKYVHFEPIQPRKIQYKKIGIGVGGMGVLYLLLKGLVPSSIQMDMIRYAALMLWMSVGAPYFFVKISRKMR